MTPHLEIAWARDAAEVSAAQRLRYQVFAGELGARLDTAGVAAGLDADRFDPFCDHLIVRAGPPDAGIVVGTYRVLPPARARAAGGYYTDTEFDLAPLAPLRRRALELGRSCVHPAWRSGSVILAMWGALGSYMQRHRLETMIGCASIGMADGGANAAALWRSLRRTHLAPSRWHVTPHHPLPDVGAAEGPAVAPPLLKGYLRCGARVIGAPALDTAFGTADLPLMLRMEDMAPRYRRRLLQPPAG
ncbi:GNAT family N-acyltransferase [Ramlibacter sp. PS3R-8]|uniref:GNAT family N-acetyltransferase n=1 Tax=Ramlibacter sp. PS3R-8 TaxID=3133437 RepID=UPI0030B3855B